MKPRASALSASSKTCAVKAHTRSIPVRPSLLGNAIHCALVKETGFKFRVKAGRKVQ